MKKQPFVFIILFYCLSIATTFAQGANEIILFSGVVVDEEQNDPVPGVHIYIPKFNRGVSTSPEGVFVLPVLPSDSIIVSAVGYKTQFFKIPKDRTDSYSVVIELVEDTTLLSVVEVFPYPTEELFKEAILSMELADQEQIENMRKNLDQQLMVRMAYEMPMNGSMNYRYQMDQNAMRLQNRTSIPSLQLLNPFAWARFIKSVKRGDYKKGKWKKR